VADDWEAYLDSLAAFGMRPGLERVEALLQALGRPQRTFRAIHVVGTNGKSSTTRYAEALLREHGVRSSAYLSPHITGWPERVVIDGAPVDTDAFGRAVEQVRAAVAALPTALGDTTQFEVLTVAAFLAIAEAGVQAAVIEAGLGGRLDATNVLHSPVVVLTNVALEHTEVLGDTREAIFAEKAAVIHGGDVVFGPLEGLEPLAEARCAVTGAHACLWGREVRASGSPEAFDVTLADRLGRRAYGGLRLPTMAAYQVGNAALAVAAVDLLLGGLNEERVRAALAQAAVPGRLQMVRRSPVVLADGAHNPHGARALAASLSALDRPSPRVLLLAVMRDKAFREMLAALLPLADAVVCTQAGQPRSLKAGELASAVREVGRQQVVTETPDPQSAYAEALRQAGAEGSVLVTGSLYLLEELAGVLAGEGEADG
jgi:dihydrofolate synthase / folylpolyglutamate synthase